ncbi:MAG: PAS domain S-box protein [Bacteroidales bacterium]|nr:PAS domain S-box protein [Bacteroidales bacterium]
MDQKRNKKQGKEINLKESVKGGANLLRDSERRYRLLFKNMINGLLVLKPIFKEGKLVDFQFFRANATFEKMTGLNATKIIGCPFKEVFPGKASDILPMLFETVKQNENQRLENFPLKAGTIVNFYSFIPEEDYVAIIIEDVTAQKKAELERTKSEQMLKTIFSLLPVGVTVTDESGDIIDCNKASESLLGLKKEEHLIRNFAGKEWKIVRTDLTPMPPEEFASVRALKENRIVENVEMGIVKEEDQVTWINVNAAPIPLPDLGVAIVYSDITERVQAQEESEEKFKNVVQNSTDAIIIVNPEGSIIEWNKGCELIFGIDKKTALSQKIWTFLSNVVAPESPLGINNLFLKENIQHTLRTGDSPWFQSINEAEFIVSDGKRKTIQSSIFPVKSAHGYLLGIVSRDVSESKETERMLKLAKEKAEEASQAKSRFLANISHEIRTPLNAIMGFTEILKEFQVDNGRFKDHLSGIEKSSKALMSLINDILDLSRMEAGKMEVSPEALNIRNLIDDVQQIFSLKAENKGIDLQTHVDPCVPAVIRMDEVRLRQVLFNLVGNAVKFTEKGSVSINVRTDNYEAARHLTDLTIMVSDTGIGIEEEDMDLIFDPFYQKAPLRIAKQEGTGLGLAISRRFVQMMNGEIKVDSRPGAGTRFSVILHNVSVLKARKHITLVDEGSADLKKGPKKTQRSIDYFESQDFLDLIRKEIGKHSGSENNAQKFLDDKIWWEFDKIADILGFEEVRDFAQNLLELAQKENLPNLASFASKLRDEARAFNVIGINQLLASFEKLRK